MFYHHNYYEASVTSGDWLPTGDPEFLLIPHHDLLRTHFYLRVLMEPKLMDFPCDRNG